MCAVGLWGGAWGCFCAGSEGGQGEEGASGGPSLLLTWSRQPEGGCPPRGAEGLNLGQEAGGWGQAGPHRGSWASQTPPPGREAGPLPKCWPRVFPGWGVGHTLLLLVSGPCFHRRGAWRHSWPVAELESETSSDTHEGLTRSRLQGQPRASHRPLPQSWCFLLSSSLCQSGLNRR